MTRRKPRILVRNMTRRMPRILVRNRGRRKPRILVRLLVKIRARRKPRILVRYTSGAANLGAKLELDIEGHYFLLLLIYMCVSLST